MQLIGSACSEVMFEPLGEQAILVRLGDVISQETSREAAGVARAIVDAGIRGVIDVVPAYTSLAIYFDDAVTTRERVTQAVTAVCSMQHDMEETVPRLIQVPARYDGVDLGEVAELTGLSIDDVVERHAAPTYYAYMLGFVPGFAYLGDLDASLALPRRTSPRQRVPAGSVAIAGAQTAVYPLVTPGGWHIIGSTAITMFDPTRAEPALIRAGDNVRFVPVRD